MKEVIYVLEDPRDHAIRYVGRTARPVVKRLAEHITVTYMRNQDLVTWIAELRALGLLPILHVIDSAPDKPQAIEREQLWIRWYLVQGEPLLNAYRPKKTHRPPLCLSEMSEQKLLQIAVQTGERPQVIIGRLLDAEISRTQAEG